MKSICCRPTSFNALLKSIEEPPPHVIFMMATTEQHKIPDTVLSRSQVYEFRTISGKVVADRLRLIAAEEQIEIPEEGLTLLARAGEGSMRDSLSAFDQVRAFAGDQIAVDDVVTVLGLVGRDLVFDMLDAVVSEDAPAAFALVERAIERGYELRLLCRELARATRDLLILSVDPKRASDPDVAGDAERERLLAMSGHWSREDLMRAFDLLTKAEQEIRVSDQPRYNLEMALLQADASAEARSARRTARARRKNAARVPIARRCLMCLGCLWCQRVLCQRCQRCLRHPVEGTGTGHLGTNPLGTPGTVGTLGT